MKNFGVIIFVLLFGSLTIISCKKDYTCKCTITWKGIIDTSMSTSGTINDSKDNAKSKCEQSNGTTTDGYGDTIITNCSIQ